MDAKTVAKTIKDNGINIYEVLEELGYFQHILAGKEYIEARINVLLECEDISCDEDETAFVKNLTEKVFTEGNFDDMNNKTDSMTDADTDLVDAEIIRLSQCD